MRDHFYPKFKWINNSLEYVLNLLTIEIRENKSEKIVNNIFFEENNKTSTNLKLN